MPDDLLGPLGDGPLPPLAPAAAVRARGDQRRRRGAAALAGATALSLVLGAGAASLLLGGEERDALQADPQPRVTSSPSAEPTPTPATSPAPTQVPSPRATQQAAPAPTSTRRPARPATGLLLTIEDAARAEPGDWRREGQDVEGPLLDPCSGGAAYPRDADVRESAATELLSRREAGGTSVVQTVAKYDTEEAARDAAAGYERAVRACPEREGDPQVEGSGRRHEVVSEEDVEGVPTLLVRSESTCEGCVFGYAYFAVQQSGDVVSVLVAEIGEDGDPGVDLVRPFAREAARKLA